MRRRVWKSVERQSQRSGETKTYLSRNGAQVRREVGRKVGDEEELSNSRPRHIRTRGNYIERLQEVWEKNLKMQTALACDSRN